MKTMTIRVCSLLLATFAVTLLLAPTATRAQSWLPPGNNESGEIQFLDASEVFKVEAVATDDGRTRILGTIAPGYYLYRHRLSAQAGGDDLALSLSQGIEKNDEFFGRTEVYYDTVDILVDAAATTARLNWQGCADAGICYPPQTMAVTLPRSATSDAPATASHAPAIAAPIPARPARTSGPAEEAPAAASAPQTSDAPVEAAEDQQFASRLADAGILASVVAFFGMGLLLAFTPCVLPMIPIVSSLVVGGQPTPRRALGLSLAYVLPMASTYAALGVAAGLAGANLQAALQNPWLLGAFAALFVILALSMFGAFELQLPSWLSNRLDRAGRRQQGGTLVGAGLLGVLSALLVGPCMTAPLAGALLFISQTGSALTGGFALFALGLGMGLPLLAIAMFGARILPRPGAWMDRVKAVFGYVMLGLAVSMLARVLAPSTVLVLWGALLLAVAVGFFGMVAPVGSTPLRQGLPRFLALASTTWGLALMLAGAAGAHDPWQPLAGFGAAVTSTQADGLAVDYVQAKTAADLDQRLAEAGARGEWTLVDFYADWCVSCHVIEREVFGDPRVAQVLAGMQVVRPDVTANDDADKALMRAWQVAGPPTLMLIGPDGQERRADRTVGEIGADRFLERLLRVQAGN